MYSVGRRGVVIEVVFAGTGPTLGNVPNTPLSKVKLRSVDQLRSEDVGAEGRQPARLGDCDLVSGFFDFQRRDLQRSVVRQGHLDSICQCQEGRNVQPILCEQAQQAQSNRCHQGKSPSYCGWQSRLSVLALCRREHAGGKNVVLILDCGQPSFVDDVGFDLSG